MRILIDNSQDCVELTKNIEGIIDKSVTSAINHEGLKHKCEVNVMLVDDEQIKQINKEHRKIDKATDVLSFPMLDFNVEKDDKFAYNGEYLMLGDIVLSLEKAVEQAEEYGHSIEREVGFLCVHSTLHLLGYNHDNEENTKVMRGKEEAILSSISLTR